MKWTQNSGPYRTIGAALGVGDGRQVWNRWRVAGIASTTKTTTGSSANSPSSTGLGRRRKPAYWSTKTIAAGASTTRPTYLRSQKTRLTAGSPAASAPALTTPHWARAANTTTSEAAVGPRRKRQTYTAHTVRYPAPASSSRLMPDQCQLIPAYAPMKNAGPPKSAEPS